MDARLIAFEEAGIGREDADDAERIGMLAKRAAYWMGQWSALYEKTRPKDVRCYVWPGCMAPEYKTAGAAGADCRARSGLAESHGIAMVNGIGTIDSDYRGEVSAMLITP